MLNYYLSYHFFKNLKKQKLNNRVLKKLLSEKPFYKQSIKKPRELPFYDDIIILRNERTFRGYAKTYKAEVINNRNLSDLLSAIKNSVKILFDELLRKKGLLNIL